jgi:hypothetical protein
MTTKAAYLTNLAGKSYIQDVGTPVLEQSDAELNLKLYEVSLSELSGTSAMMATKHKFLVYDEGGGSEAAYPFGPIFKPYYRENDTVYAAIKAYVDGLSAVKGFKIVDFDTVEQWAKVYAFVYVTDHIEEKYYFVYVDGTLTHKEII